MSSEEEEEGEEGEEGDKVHTHTHLSIHPSIPQPFKSFRVCCFFLGI